MKKIALLLALAAALFLIGRSLVRALASDETKIRRVVEAMAEGFDRTRMDPILRGLAPDFQDETSGADRQTLREGLAYLFFTAKDEPTKRFRYRVEIEIQTIAVARDGHGAPTADCEVSARFLDLQGGKETPAWEIAVTAHLARGEEGWRIRRTSYATRSGRMLR